MSDPTDPMHVRWATGPVGGSWHRIVAGIAELLAAEGGVRVEIVAAGGRENPDLVEGGDCEFGTTIDFVSAAAWRGSDPYDAPHPSLRCIGGGWSPLPFHFVGSVAGSGTLLQVLAKPGVHFGIPPQSTFDELTFRRVLGFAGTSYDALRAHGGSVLHADYQRLPQAFIEGAVDFFFGATSAPGEPVLKLGRRAGAALLPIDAPLITHLRDAHGYGVGHIRRADYPALASDDLPAPVMDTVFLVHRDVPSAIVERITGVLVRHRARLAQIHPSLAAFDPTHSVRSAPVPLHPGAQAAYAEHAGEAGA